MLSSRHEHFQEVGRLAAVAIAGQCITFAVNMVLARNLSVQAYEAYVVAAAIFLLLLAVASQGIDKYSLRILPGKFEKRQWRLAEGFFAFAVSRVLLGSLLVAVLAAVWARELREYPPETLRAVYIGLLALPVGVLTHFLSAVLSATGDCVRAAAITLLIVPAISLLFVTIAMAAPVELSGALGIACWAAAWCLGLAIAALWVQRAWPARGRDDGVAAEKLSWRREALPFWLYRLSMGVIAQIAVLMLDWLQPSAAAVGAYAAAMSTATLAAVLAIATNRVYARELSILMEVGDYTAVSRLRLQRLQWMLPALGIFLLLALVFTREILALFNPEFVDEGIATFRILVTTTCITVALSVAPIYLKYHRQNRITFSTLTSCALLQVVLLALLVPRMEATGAALAYMVSMVGMYGFLTAVALRQFQVLRGKSG